MREDRQQLARDALSGLSEAEKHQVLGILCADRPEALLAAVEALQRHRATIDRLLQRGPAADSR